MQLVSGYLSHLAQSSLEHRSLLRDILRLCLSWILIYRNIYVLLVHVYLVYMVVLDVYTYFELVFIQNWVF